MNINKEIEKLIQNRMMETDEEIKNFEEALESLVKIKDVSIIPLLCKGFDDDTDEDEIMFNLLHIIEDFEGVEALKHQVSAMPYMTENNAKMWAKVMNYRILNSSEYRLLYTSVLQSLPQNIGSKVTLLLKEIKESNSSKFSSNVDEVLSNLEK